MQASQNTRVHLGATVILLISGGRNVESGVEVAADRKRLLDRAIDWNKFVVKQPHPNLANTQRVLWVGAVELTS